MSFKERKGALIEEGYQDKLDNAWGGVKDFTKNNQGLAAIGGTAAAGALANYLTDGASDLEDDRIADKAAIPGEVKADIAQNTGVSKGEFSDFANDYANAHDKESGPLGNSFDAIRWLVPGMNTDADALKNVTSQAATNDSFSTDGGAAVDGYNVRNDINMDANYDLYQKHLAANPSDANQTTANAEIANAEANQDRSIANATRDSYLQAAGVGAGAGAAGLFAKRKLDQSRQ